MSYLPVACLREGLRGILRSPISNSLTFSSVLHPNFPTPAVACRRHRNKESTGFLGLLEF
ncbi:MAG: hypothetical protein ACP5D4_08390 [Baaleninema sp.]